MENPKFIFSSGPIELKEQGKDFFVEGYLSTSDLDLVNDIVTKDCLLDMAEQMKARTIKMDVEHESFRGGTDLELEINKTIIPIAKIESFSVDEKGLKIKTILNKHSQRFEEVKGSIKGGFLDAFSIAFIPVETKTEIRNGQEVRLLNRINLLNSAYTGNPVNTTSTMTNVFAKSLEFLKDKENHDHLGDNNLNKQEVNKMSDEESKETQEAKETEEKPAESESEEKAKKKPDKEDEEEEDEDEKKKKKVSKKDEAESESKEPEKESTEESAEKKEGSKEEGSEESGTETKSEIQKLKEEMVEVKAALKRPLLKSRAEQQDKSENFVEEKALDPLDVIA